MLVQEAMSDMVVDPKQDGGAALEKHTTIIIPAFNEEEGVPAVLDEVYEAIDEGYEVLVVDDGSTDGTLEAALRYPCRIVRHLGNSGKGAAMRTGITLASGQNIVFIDADGTYPADLIPEIVRYLEDGYGHVRCTRSEGRGEIPALNRVGNFLLDLGITTFSGLEGNDFLTGLYGVKRNALLDMEIVSQGFDVEAEIAVKAGAMGLRPKAIPFTYRERIGEAKLQSLPDGFRIGLRVLNTGFAYNSLLGLFVPGAILALAGVCGLAWAGVSAGVQSLRIFALSLIVGLLGGHLVAAGLCAGRHAFTQGVRRRFPGWAQSLARLLANRIVFWASVAAGLGGLGLAVWASPTAHALWWGVGLFSFGLQMAVVSMSLTIAARLSERAPEVVAHEEVGRR